MSEPITWQTLEIIQARMASITIANGFYTDAGNEIDLEDGEIREPVDDVDTPSPVFPRLAIFEESFAPTGSRPGAGIGTQTVVIAGIVDAAANAAEITAHRLRHDIVAAALTLRQQDFAEIRPGGVSTVTLTGERDILRQSDGMNVLVVQVRVVLTCIEQSKPV